MICLRNDSMRIELPLGLALLGPPPLCRKQVVREEDRQDDMAFEVVVCELVEDDHLFCLKRRRVLVVGFLLISTMKSVVDDDDDDVYGIRCLWIGGEMDGGSESVLLSVPMFRKTVAGNEGYLVPR